jgi:hypothetical protein
MHLETFLRFMRVRGTLLGPLSDSIQSKIRGERTKDVRRAAANALKPLI